MIVYTDTTEAYLFSNALTRGIEKVRGCIVEGGRLRVVHQGGKVAYYDSWCKTRKEAVAQATKLLNEKIRETESYLDKLKKKKFS